MQTIEKALHQPMPFTTGGQTISDRLTAAKHSLAGSQLGKTICKATTEELMAPKKKHLDYLLHCTNEPNVSIPSMANLLIERTQHPNWTVVYKALITIHNIMCYGNERFSQYLASCNTTFNLGNFLDKNSTAGYDMSQHVRKYGKYIGEKIATYRVCAFDFCKVKRGREDGLLRTMHTDKLLKTLPILQNQIDALLEFQVSASELNNGVINCSFILLFRDLIRLFACYNDGIINLLEKYFDMNKKQCRDALDTYKGFLTRLDKVSEFLRVAESVGIDRGEIPDLTRAPASLLEALEAHLIHLEGGRAPSQSQYPSAQSQLANFSMAGGFQMQPHVGDVERMRYIELEKERLRQFEEQKRLQGSGGSTSSAATSSFNPFATDTTTTSEPTKKTNEDLLDLFNPPTQQPTQPIIDATNPFAQFAAPTSVAQTGAYPSVGGVMVQPVVSSQGPQTVGQSNGFQTDFARAFANGKPSNSNGDGSSDTNPFLMTENATQSSGQQMWQPDFGISSVTSGGTNNVDLSQMGSAAPGGEGVIDQFGNPFGVIKQEPGSSPFHGGPLHDPRFSSSNSSTNDSPVPFHLQQQQQPQHPMQQQQQQPQHPQMQQQQQQPQPPQMQQQQQQQPQQLQMQQQQQPQQLQMQQQQQPQQQQQTPPQPADGLRSVPSAAPPPIPPHPKGIYENTPFSHTDGSYSTQPSYPPSMMQPSAGSEKSMDQSQGSSAQQNFPAQQQGAFDPFATQQTQPKIGGDIDSALSNLAENLTISGSNQGRPVQWTGPQQQGQSQVPVSSSMPAPTVAPQMPSYGAPPQYTTPYGQYPQTYGGQMPQWQMQHPQMFTAPQQAPAPGYMYGGAPMGYGQMPSQPHPQQGQDPFGGF